MNKHKKVEIRTWGQLVQTLVKAHIQLGQLTEKRVEIIDFTEKKLPKSYVSIVPGVVKLVLEAFDNSVDEAVRTNGDFCKRIDFKINKDTFVLKDTGRGVPLNGKGENDEKAIDAFTTIGSSGNYVEVDGSDEERTTTGINGMGVALLTLFSKQFEVINSDVYTK